MAYEFPNKNMQRLMVHAMYKECPDQKPIVFLDDETAGACKYFMKEGIPGQHLKPVNYTGTHAAAITKTSGIPCACDNINAHLSSLTTDSRSAVWLDYTCTTVNEPVLREALRVAPRVMVNASLRGLVRDIHFQHIRNLIKKVGVLRLGPYPYKGKAGVENMMSFIVDRFIDDDDTKAPGYPRTRENTLDVDDTEVFAIDDTPTFRVNDSVAVAWRGHASLTAVVLGTSDNQVRVKFDCDGVVKWMPMDNVTHHRTECDATKLNALVGETILIPTKLWSAKKMTGYGDVKVVGKKLAFVVTKRYYKNRYTIAGISKRDNRPLRKREGWTLTYEQVCCYTKCVAKV